MPDLLKLAQILFSLLELLERDGGVAADSLLVPFEFILAFEPLRDRAALDSLPDSMLDIWLLVEAVDMVRRRFIDWTELSPSMPGLWLDESPFSLAFGERPFSAEGVASLLALLTDKSTEKELRDEVSEKPPDVLCEGVSVLSVSAGRFKPP